MISSIVPNRTGKFFVTIIILEQTDWFTCISPDDNLTLFTVFARSAVGLDEVDVILRIGQTHRSWFRFGPWHCAERHCRFRLSEALHKGYACELLKLVEYGCIDSLTGCTTVA